MFDPAAFSTDFALPVIQPAPDLEDEPDSEQGSPESGPWIGHGVVHVGHKPNH